MKKMFITFAGIVITAVASAKLQEKYSWLNTVERKGGDIWKSLREKVQCAKKEAEAATEETTE